jgi:drug/metabolite transporter (DMT)-like permease
MNGTPMNGTLTGVGAALTASALYGVAVGLQALEARRVPARHSLQVSLLTHLARRPLWLLGAATGLLGWVLQAFALSVAPLTLVAPTLATSLVFLLLIGVIAFREPVGRDDAVGLLAVAFGVAGLGLIAPARSETHSTANGTILLLALLAAVVIAPLALRASRRAPAPNQIVAVGAGVAYGLVALTTKFADDDLRSARLSALVVWLCAIGVIATLGVLNEMSALQRQPVTQVAPVVFGLNVIVPVLLAPMLAGESWKLSGVERSLLLASLIAVIAGIISLSRSNTVVAVLAQHQP